MEIEILSQTVPFLIAGHILYSKHIVANGHNTRVMNTKLKEVILFWKLKSIVHIMHKVYIAAENKVISNRTQSSVHYVFLPPPPPQTVGEKVSH